MKNRIWNIVGIIGAGFAAAILWSQTIAQVKPSMVGPRDEIGLALLGLRETATFGGDFRIGAFLFPFVIGCAVMAFIMYVVHNGQKQKERNAAAVAETQQSLLP